MCFATLDWFWCQWMYIPIWWHVCKSPSVIKTTVNNICSGFCCCCKQPQQPRPTTTTTATKTKYRAPFLCLERNLGRRSRFFSLSSFPFAKCKTMQLYALTVVLVSVLPRFTVWYARTIHCSSEWQNRTTGGIVHADAMNDKWNRERNEDRASGKHVECTWTTIKKATQFS